VLRDADADDPLEDDEWPDDGDSSDGEDSIDLLPCASCGKMVAEGTQRCPHCGDWIVTRVADRGGWRRWMWSIAAVIVMLMITWFWR